MEALTLTIPAVCPKCGGLGFYDEVVMEPCCNGYMCGCGGALSPMVYPVPCDCDSLDRQAAQWYAQQPPDDAFPF